MHRLFVALRPPPPMRRMLLAAMHGVANARWQDDAQLHLTLRFIGEVERPQAEEIAAALQAIDGPQPGVRLDGVGTFDRRGLVHTLWARVAADAALVRLHQRIGRALVRAGVAPEARAFRPHITLARLSRPSLGIDGFVQTHAGLSSPPAILDSFQLFESQLGSEGATYHSVARYPLR